MKFYCLFRTDILKNIVASQLFLKFRMLEYFGNSLVTH